MNSFRPEVPRTKIVDSVRAEGATESSGTRAEDLEGVVANYHYRTQVETAFDRAQADGLSSGRGEVQLLLGRSRGSAIGRVHVSDSRIVALEARIATTACFRICRSSPAAKHMSHSEHARRIMGSGPPR